jgi:hypothetical protein
VRVDRARRDVDVDDDDDDDAMRWIENTRTHRSSAGGGCAFARCRNAVGSIDRSIDRPRVSTAKGRRGSYARRRVALDDDDD